MQGHKTECNLDSNLQKIRWLNPEGGVAGIPAWVLQEQKGEILGFKCGGAYVAANNAASNAWRTEKLVAIFKESLLPLDQLDRDLVDEEGTTDAHQIRFFLLRVNASAIARSWARVLSPRITIQDPGHRAEGSDARLYARLSSSFNRTTRPSPEDVIARLRLEAPAPLPTSIGGTGVGGMARLCEPAYVASIFACLERLHATPGLHDEARLYMNQASQD